METRAPYTLIGAFLLAVILGLFGFIYWIQNTGGLGERKTYQVRFENSVSGLLTGAPVLFNGIRVGEVSSLGLVADRPKEILVSIAISQDVPVRADTQVGLDFQGLTGVAVVTLTGGTPLAPLLAANGNGPPLLVANPANTQSVMEAARSALQRVDTLLSDNSAGVKSTIDNLKTFTDALAKNSDKVDQILGGISQMFGGSAKPAPRIFDIAAARDFPPRSDPGAAIIIDDPTTVSALDAQRVMKRGEGDEFTAFPDTQWSDALPKLVQSRLIQSLENAGRTKVARPLDNVEADHHLVTEIRSFQVTGTPPQADVELSARVVGEGGKLLDAKIFHASVPLDSDTPQAAAVAFNRAFGTAATDLVNWVSGLI
jgi:phospholipid/cholesterol/gamma-HCH transport system substrate-binding protein